VLTSDPKIVCTRDYTQTVRNVPQRLKEQVYKEYGITSREPGEYEIDHIISLELGGTPPSATMIAVCSPPHCC